MGKTTFVKLITGTLAPSDGELLINGIAVEKINPIGWYDRMSTVVQDPARYVTFTVADNVFLGDTAKPKNEEEIDAAMMFSGMDGIEKDALLGKDIGGTELSGGEWQKLAIARAAYRNNDFIILDEPTSNLDPLAETEVFQKYIALAEDKTVIFVTHRISVASLADRIIVFADGKIIQDGTHDELANIEGEYSRLYKEQAKWYNR
jgi:ATP-binding cassette subfamily B protein